MGVRSATVRLAAALSIGALCAGALTSAVPGSSQAAGSHDFGSLGGAQTTVTYYAVSDLPHNGKWTWYDANNRPKTLDAATFFTQRSDGKWYGRQTVVAKPSEPRIGMTFASRGQYAGCRIFVNGERVRLNVARKNKDATVRC